MDVSLRLSKKAVGLFRQFFAVCCAIMYSPLADTFHTCSLICVFVHVHAAAENGFYFIRCLRSELCEAFP